MNSVVRAGKNILERKLIITNKKAMQYSNSNEPPNLSADELLNIIKVRTLQS